jgi:hypothetical protein
VSKQTGKVTELTSDTFQAAKGSSRAIESQSSTGKALENRKILFF